MAKRQLLRHSIWILFSFLLINVLVYPSVDRPIRQGSVEVILGSYDMNEPRFEAVYPAGGLMAGLALSAAIVSDLNLYLEAKYYGREGELSFSKEKTKFYMVPVSLGLRYIFSLGLLNPYVGGGLDYYFYSEDNPIGSTTDSAFGYHVGGGALLRFSRTFPLMLNLKVKYTWARAEKEDIRVQLGGLEYGAGLLFSF